MDWLLVFDLHNKRLSLVRINLLLAPRWASFEIREANLLEPFALRIYRAVFRFFGASARAELQ